MIFPLDITDFSNLMRKHAKVEAPLTSLTATIASSCVRSFAVKFVTARYPRHGSLVTETYSRSKVCP